ncbi:His/Gly/Thr/Pro-type tRNA ligase C-terminal domain-containing protein [Spongiactinospora sp. TRM90649]|uniref:His/Gly/Thr/Pro-type tRNA ligase C-terminal domain-containing protein n=1 Tax=Spongiactinospora sp. TRM90649 TaxID=3031114 RepID=UPI0023F825F7|nr:His/Gly/Thr/Pro-type tRNA ligase C-terminal domain-containing protein [Spongiactinospora sp. TRM90649]MDF5752959.1 His/Gly/Thr/Pro-type tRNA ligase C-terminal domain-containing protein [Spongiactinospora sp. TRM90649]
MERIIGLLDGDDREIGGLDVAVTVMDDEWAKEVMGFAGRLRSAGLRSEIYLGSSRKLAKQLKWAADRRARFALIYGRQERTEGLVTVRDMDSGDQKQISIDQLAAHLTERCVVSR